MSITVQWLCVECRQPLPSPTADPFRCPACRAPKAEGQLAPIDREIYQRLDALRDCALSQKHDRAIVRSYLTRMLAITARCVDLADVLDALDELAMPGELSAEYRRLLESRVEQGR